MLQPQKLSNKSYPYPNNSIPRTDIYFFKIHSNVVLLCTPKVLKAHLSSSILAKCPSYFNLLDLITLTLLCARYKLLSYSLRGLFPPPQSHPSWAQIFAAGSYFQISLA